MQKIIQYDTSYRVYSEYIYRVYSRLERSDHLEFRRFMRYVVGYMIFDYFFLYA